jgi:hypothetical protein
MTPTDPTTRRAGLSLLALILLALGVVVGLRALAHRFGWFGWWLISDCDGCGCHGCFCCDEDSCNCGDCEGNCATDRCCEDDECGDTSAAGA